MSYVPTESLNFEVSSALKSVIGKDLITNDFVAIFELVKNSFDADAKKVDITFETSNNNTVNKIYISDNGKGMSYEDIVSKWLFVAYSAKQDETEDLNKKKVYAGNKGVGRFSCDRLGANLRLEAKSKNDSFVHVVTVNWGDFEQNSKAKFENIDIQYSTQKTFTNLPDNSAPKDNGVLLEISNLREPDSWSRKKLLSLKRHLSKLINPFGDALSPVKLSIKCERELAEDLTNDATLLQSIVINGEVRNTIFELLKNTTAWLQVELNNDGFFISTLIDRGEKIYQIKESASIYPNLLDTEFKCELFYLNQSAKSAFKRRTDEHSINFGSLFLFRNGFRVFPIGEEEDDFWKINRRKAQGYSRYLGTREVMGRVDIAGPETKFKESSSRDKGLVETEASKELFECVTKQCLRRLESYVVGVNWVDKDDKDYDTAERLGLDSSRSRIIELVSKLAGSKEIELLDYSHNLIDVLHEKSNHFEESIEKLAKLASNIKDNNLKGSIDQARRKFSELKKEKEQALKIADTELKARKEAEKVAKKEIELRVKAEKTTKVVSTAYEQEKKRNLFLASNENRDKEQLESFLHQIIIYSSAAKQKTTSTLLKTQNPIKELSSDQLVDALGDILESVEKIITTSRFATNANFKLDATKINDDLCLYIDQYLTNVSTAYNSRIEIKFKTTANKFITTFTPIELGMVLDNLVNNAKKSRAALITFSADEKTSGVLEISIEDNGRGLDKSLIEPHRIFEKGVTTTKGSGLGLYHSQKQIEQMGGELFLAPDQPTKGLKIIMKLKKS